MTSHYDVLVRGLMSAAAKASQARRTWALSREERQVLNTLWLFQGFDAWAFNLAQQKYLHLTRRQSDRMLQTWITWGLVRRDGWEGGSAGCKAMGLHSTGGRHRCNMGRRRAHFELTAVGLDLASSHSSRRYFARADMAAEGRK